MSLVQKFDKACNDARKFSKKPTDTELKEIYALYKQATIGNVNIAKPSDLKALAKWNAWQSKLGMSSDEAMEKYTELITKLLPLYK